MNHPFLLHLAIAGSLLLPAATTLAQSETIWQGTPESDWIDPLNWTNGVPEANNEGVQGVAVITNGDEVNLTDHASPVGVSTLTVGHGSLNLANTTLDLRNVYYVGYDPVKDRALSPVSPVNSPRLIVGSESGTVSHLTLSNGAKITGGIDPSGPGYDLAPQLYSSWQYADVYVGLNAGSTGHFVAEGAGTEVGVSLFIGAGYLFRVPGPTLQFDFVPGGNATGVIRDGAYAKEGVTVGKYLGTGSLTIENGGRVDHSIEVGTSGGIGSVLIRDGAIVNGSLHVGYLSMGSAVELTQSGEGRIVISGPDVLVNASTHSNPDRLEGAFQSMYIGSGLDRGYVTIENGAKVNISSLTMGENQQMTNVAGGEGELLVTGDGTELNILPTFMKVNGLDYIYGSTIAVGNTDYGRITVADGATLRAVQYDESDLLIAEQGYNQTSFVLGVTVGPSNEMWGTPLRNGKGILQIGDGARAGKVILDEIRTGQGTGEVIFKHTETDYEFDVRITTTTNVTAASGRTILKGNSDYTGKTAIAEGAALVGGHENAFGKGELQVYGTLGVDSNVETLLLHDYVELNGGGGLAVTVGQSTDPIIYVDGDIEFFTDFEAFNLELTLSDNFDYAAASEWTLITVTGDIYYFDSSMININLDGWSIREIDGSLILTYAAIPEPSTYALLLGAGALAGWLHRRRRVQA